MCCGRTMGADNMSLPRNTATGASGQVRDLRGQACAVKPLEPDFKPY